MSIPHGYCHCGCGAHPAAKLTVEQVAEIRTLAGSETMAATGRRFGVTLQAVSRIQSGKGWAD